jgi:hypothetical protein
MTLEPLRDGLDDALRTWAEPARQHIPSALFCAAANPFDPSTLCRRLDGHPGLHSADGLDAWTTPTETED